MSNNYEHSLVDNNQLTDYIRQLHEAQSQIRHYLDTKIGLPPIQYSLEQDSVHLNAREYEILFLLFLGKTDGEVCQYLAKIHGEKAGSTMIAFKHWMYNRLKVKSTEELINKALALNLIKDIPASFKIPTS